MNTALWVAAGPGGGWTGHAHSSLVRTLGLLQLPTAFGFIFILPPLGGVLPVMVPVTAACRLLLMLGAMATHLRFDGVSVYILLNTVYLSPPSPSPCSSSGAASSPPPFGG